jgi:hypothetical protein
MSTSREQGSEEGKWCKMKIKFICEECANNACRLSVACEYYHTDPTEDAPKHCPFGLMDGTSEPPTTKAHWIIENPECESCVGGTYTAHEVQKQENYMPRSVEFDYEKFCPKCDGTGFLRAVVEGGE